MKYFTVKSLLFLIFSLAISSAALAKELDHLHDAEYSVCFTPGGNCTQLIIDKLNDAKQSIYVQAYSFTSVPIANALVQASKRNVSVKVILDKSQNGNNKSSCINLLIAEGIETYIDYKPAIAHNKVMVIDDKTVITGSFNFTNAAQLHNAENLFVIVADEIARKYMDNWFNRMSQSVLAVNYPNGKNRLAIISHNLPNS